MTEKEKAQKDYLYVCKKDTGVMAAENTCIVNS